MKLTVMKLPDAIEIVSWKYPEPYSFYNFEDTQELMDELLDGTYFSVRDSRNQLIGFFVLGRTHRCPRVSRRACTQEKMCVILGLG